MRLRVRHCLVALACLAIPSTAHAGDYTRTKNPIVLVPGVLGFDRMFGVVDYFFGIPDALRDDGAEVYLVQLDAFNSIEARGEALLQRLRAISAISGSSRLNVITHSQGGLDARYVMAVRPDLFASLTTIGTPHQGAPLADFLLANTTPDGFTREVGLALADTTGFFLNLFAGEVHSESSLGTLQSISSSNMLSFNERYAAGLPSTHCGSGAASWNGIMLYSWSGAQPFTNPFDPTDYPFGVASLIASESSDGLVEHCSAHYGTVIRDDYAMNHGDEINQVLGMSAFFGTNPVSLYRAHANRLKGQGL